MINFKNNSKTNIFGSFGFVSIKLSYFNRKIKLLFTTSVRAMLLIYSNDSSCFYRNMLPIK